MTNLSKHNVKEMRKEEINRIRENEERSIKNRKTTKRIVKYSMSIIIVAAIIFGGYSYLKVKENEPGEYDGFAKCLTEKNVVMAGAYWCPHCTNQKKLFGKSFKYVVYKECDPKGPGADPAFCDENGVESYPTWIINGQKYSGEQSLQKLSQLSNCTLE